MKAYIGSKIILAEPRERDGEPGYLVVYANPGNKRYESWSPKDVFEEAYREVNEGEMLLVAYGAQGVLDELIREYAEKQRGD